MRVVHASTCAPVAAAMLFAGATSVFAQSSGAVAAAGRLQQLGGPLALVAGHTAAPLASAPPQQGTTQPAAQAPPPPAQPAPATSKVFNPDISVIGNFIAAAGKFGDRPSFALDEVEAAFQSIVDPYARADFFVAVSPEGAELEEGFITFTSLPGGFLLKAGKLKASLGKVNTLHAHVLPWADRPLVSEQLVGGEEGFADAGLSLSKLIPNSVLFLEATGEVFRGNSSLFQSHQRSKLSYVGKLRGYRDLTESSNLDLGVSAATGSTDLGGDSSARVFAVDATFRYRPLRRAIYRSFLARTEFFWNRQDVFSEAFKSFGWYASGDYQFARRWRVGGRYDFTERLFDSTLKDKGISALLTFRPSEFSTFRTQYKRHWLADGPGGHEVLFQLLFSIGAHGAHVF